VLKGHIGLASAIFPAGTSGCQIDYAARVPLWKNLRDFGHGTGHGIGFYLNVHEGPQEIRHNFNSQALLPGMITSDEPGLYREGMHGIRHESLLLCTELCSNEFGSWLCFENLTLCHIDTSPVVGELLTGEEKNWLNSYNECVWQTLSPRLPEEVRDWLYTKTRPLR
jgi:Xaa-Pro aminopeptidase